MTLSRQVCEEIAALRSELASTRNTCLSWGRTLFEELCESFQDVSTFAIEQQNKADTAALESKFTVFLASKEACERLHFFACQLKHFLFDAHWQRVTHSSLQGS